MKSNRFPVVVNLGLGRSGTTYCERLFGRFYADAVFVHHETLSGRQARLQRYFRCYRAEDYLAALQEPAIAEFVETLRRQASERPVLVLGNTLGHLAPAIYHVLEDQLRCFHLHRHPLTVTASGHVGDGHSYWRSVPSYGIDANAWKLTPHDPRVNHSDVAERWDSFDGFARNLYQWLERATFAEEFAEVYPDVPFASYSAERDLFASMRLHDELCDFLEIERRDVDRSEIATNAGWNRALEAHPLGDAWKSYKALPEVVTLGQRLGYSFEEETLERLMNKYQLPKGFMPSLRHRIRFWQMRATVIDRLRRWKLAPPVRVTHDGGPPRSSAAAIQDWISWLFKGRRET